MKNIGLKIGVIGLGFIGETYVRALYDNPNVNKIFIVSSNFKKRELFRKNYQYKVEIFDSFQEMIENGKPQGVCICTPNYNHADIFQYILNIEQKIGILIEKPIAISKEQVDNLFRTTKNKDGIILVSHSLRYATPYALAKTQIEINKIGKIIYIEGRYKWFKNFSGWRSQKKLAGGGFLIQSGIHIIDIFLWYLQSPVIKIRGNSAKLFHKNIEVEDSFFGDIYFLNGSYAHMIGSSATKGFIDYVIEIYGTKGSIKVSSNAMPGGLNILNHSINIFEENNESDLAGIVVTPSFSNCNNIWKKEINNFINCLLGKEKPVVSIQEGIKAMNVCFALYESDSQNGKLIDIYIE